MYGYAGKILRLNLTNRSITTIPTRNYEQWGGGHGIGSALFFDLVKDKTIDGFHPDNLVTIMTSPLSGTLTPGCSARTEVQGIGVQAYPIGWFTRSGFGGRFSSMLKLAGWDGIAIEGAADSPVWIDIRNDQVAIRECSELSLWGMDTFDCQETIWKNVAGNRAYDTWVTPDETTDARTTQRPAVLAIGPAGEHLSRLACLVHDSANSSGQGGFGAVWGSKKLKAISVMGTGSIKIFNPDALMKARIEQTKQFAYDYDNPKESVSPYLFQSPPGGGVIWEMFPTRVQSGGKRPHACAGCHSGCRRIFESGLGNEASCSETAFYMEAVTGEIQYKATDLLNRYGINALEAYPALVYLKNLNKKGILGPGKEIECPLNFNTLGSLEFLEQFLKILAYRDDGKGNPSEFGDVLAEGALRAAKHWGRLEDGLKTGDVNYPYWGYPMHADPRTQLEWGYGSIFGDRDINEHCINRLYVFLNPKFYGDGKQLSPEEIVSIISGKMTPFHDDPLMLDYSTENMYSEHMAKLVSWQRYYTRFYKQSLLFCDNRWPDFINSYSPDMAGSTGSAEPRFLKAVTGKNISFTEGIELGRKIWNLDHAIWTLQGRHRDMVQFADYIYTIPNGSTDMSWVSKKNGEWIAINIEPRIVDKQKFEEFKTSFYDLQGWNTASGYPKRSTLESLGLNYVADELEQQGKLGAE